MAVDLENFELLGALALQLHTKLRDSYYLLLPLFFLVSLTFTWFRAQASGPDFLESVKRAFVSTLLLVGFQEITDAILFITSGLADKISDMQGLDMFLQMAGEKSQSYAVSTNSMLIGFNDLIIATLTFLSYFLLYFARYVMVAVYHVSWIFLSVVAPIVLLFHLFSVKMTLNLFKSLIEIASWKIVWAVLSAMLAALPFGSAYATSGGYLTIIVMNFVIAISMLATPMIVKSFSGSGFSSFASSLAPVTAAAMAAAPMKAMAASKIGRAAIDTTRGYVGHLQETTGQRIRHQAIARDIQKLNTPKKG